MTDPKFHRRADALAAGWFSRRHETPDANREAREHYFATRSKEARRRRAELRNGPAR